MNGLTTRYQLSSGNGQEDPAAYDMVIFDGNVTAPQSVAANVAVSHFLRAGKAVVLLNNTEAHRLAGLKHWLWGHLNGNSPATAFFIERDKLRKANRPPRTAARNLRPHSCKPSKSACP